MDELRMYDVLFPMKCIGSNLDTLLLAPTDTSLAKQDPVSPAAHWGKLNLKPLVQSEKKWALDLATLTALFHGFISKQWSHAWASFPFFLIAHIWRFTAMQRINHTWTQQESFHLWQRSADWVPLCSFTGGFSWRGGFLSRTLTVLLLT